MAANTKGAVWADQPFKLIPLPPQRLTDKRMAVLMATEMCHVHNVIIRGLNAIVLQGPNVAAERDVRDFAGFVGAWAKMVHHHHWTEETSLFPGLDRLAGQPGLMDDPLHQHGLFQPGLDRLAAYAEAASAAGGRDGPGDFRWAGEGGAAEIVDSFSAALVDHLRAEIDVLLSLTYLDDDKMKTLWREVETHAKQSGNLGMLYDVFPCVLSLCDKTFEGAEAFPPLPFFLPYVIKYWFAAGNGAFRFCPSDFFGRPRPLPFAPASAPSAK